MQLGKARLQHHQVAHLHQLAHALHRQAQVDVQVLALVVLLAFFLRLQVGGLGAHDAQQRLAAVDRQPHARQDARVHPAHIAHAQAAVVLDFHHHQADLIQVGAEHHLGPIALDVRHHVVEPVDLHLVGIRPEGRGNVFRHRHLRAGQPGRGRCAAQKFLDVHGSLPFQRPRGHCPRETKVKYSI